MSKDLRAASSRATSRESNSDEYVTNWSAIAGIAATFLLVAIGFAVMCWVEARQTKHVDSKKKINDDLANVAIQPRQMPDRLPVFRHDDDAPPPKFTAAAVRPAPPYAQRTLMHLGNATMQIIGLREQGRLEQLQQFASQLQGDAPANVDHPLAKVTPVSPSGHYFYSNEQEVLLNYLRDEVPELDMQADTKSFVELAAVEKKKMESSKQPEEKESSDEFHDPHADLLLAKLEQRQDTQGLPLLLGDACRSEREVAVARNHLAFGVRMGASALQQRSRRVSGGSQYENQILQGEEADKAFVQYAEHGARRVKGEIKWSDVKNVAIFEQILQVATPSHRQLMLRLLIELEGKEATEAIARRALFDMDKSVRDAATEALKGRKLQDYSDLLEEASNYAWSPVAERAKRLRWSQVAGVEAKELNAIRAGEDVRLMALGSHISMPHQSEDGQWMVHELVKVNHLRNCVLCHQVSTDPNDPLRGQIPSPGERLPQIYYNSNRGDFVRADTVYLRQDFSVMLPVKDHGKWPEMQRFDFFVRERPATGEDLQRAYQQRQYNASLLERSITALLQRTVELLEAGVDTFSTWQEVGYSDPDEAAADF